MTEAEILTDLDDEWVDRIGYTDEAWLVSVGTLYEARAIPHDSLDKPYFEYKLRPREVFHQGG
ncbi:hypothetical protein LAUMK191_05523 [Mycobacterium attenuatum]|nr:hypothetical protein LAUMK191_05523 [Mycobacterium attenuatum]